MVRIRYHKVCGKIVPVSRRPGVSGGRDRNISLTVSPAKKRYRLKKTVKGVRTFLEKGIPVGTGIGGGTLVTDGKGGTYEVPMSSEPSLGDRRNSGGGGNNNAVSQQQQEEIRRRLEEAQKLQREIAQRNFDREKKERIEQKRKIEIERKRINDFKNKLLMEGAQRIIRLGKKGKEKIKQGVIWFDKASDRSQRDIQENIRIVRERKRKKQKNKIILELADFELMVGSSVIGTVSSLKTIIKGTPHFVGAVYDLRKAPQRDLLIKNVKMFNAGELKKLKKLKNPKVREFVAKELYEKTKKGLRFIYKNPGATVGFVGGELLMLEAGGKVFKTGGKLGKKVLSLKSTEIISEGGKKIVRLKVKRGLMDKATRGSFKKNTILEFEVGGVKEGAESLKEALKRTGKRTQAVSVQANRLIGNRKIQGLINYIRRRTVIRKPFPSYEINGIKTNFEDLLTKKTREKLKLFDKGKLNVKQVEELNKVIRKESMKYPEILKIQPKGIDLLERNTFFDSDKLLRMNRAQLEKNQEGTLLDLIRGRASIFNKNPKPQILYIDEIIEAMPKTKRMREIEKKFNLGKELNKDELAHLSTFEVTPSGKLKGIGSTTFNKGFEREVTASTKDVLKKVRKLGTLLYKDTRIPIIEVKFVKKKLSNKIKKKFKKIAQRLKEQNLKILKDKRAKITVRKTKKFIKKEKTTGKKSGKIINNIRKITTNKKKIYPLKRKIGSLGSRVLRSKTTKNVKRTTGGTGRRTTGGTGRRTTGGTGRRTTTGGTGRRTTTGGTGRTGGGTGSTGRNGGSSTKINKIRYIGGKNNDNKVVRVLMIPKKFKRKKLKKEIQTYYVVKKDKGKFKKLNANPLRLNEAKDYLAYNLDNTLSRTSLYLVVGKRKQIVSIPNKMKGYFNKNRKKFRPFSIRQGVKQKIIHGYIENKNFVGDTRGEIKELQRSRRKTTKRKNTGVSRTKVRFITKKTISRRKRPIPKVKKRKKVVHKPRQRVKKTRKVKKIVKKPIKRKKLKKSKR